MLSLVLLAGCGGGGSDEPEPIRAKTLVVYSSLPRTGEAAEVGKTVAAGQRLALADAGGRAGGHRVELVELDSAEPDERDWDPDRVEKNAGEAADDPAAVAYLGEMEGGASAVSVPLTNEESILQVSPADGLSSLTVPQSGPGAGPERFYPERPGSFLRLVAPDSALAGPLVSVATRGGARSLALVHDGGIAGRQLAGAIEQVADDRDVEVTAVERVDPDRDEASASLARRFVREVPDAVVYTGIGGDPARTVLAALVDRRLSDVRVLGGAPLIRPGALAGAPPVPVDVVSPMLARDELPARGRRVLTRLDGRAGRAPVEALYGYESMRVVLRAIEAAAGRATDRLAVIESALRDGPRGSVLGRYRFDPRGDTTRRRLALHRVTRGEAQHLGPAPGSGP